MNNDGWIDLLVTQQWGPVRYFRNQQGVLHEETERAELTRYSGWWNGIAAGDVDHDGDIDYVVTNQGLNTKYHASPEFPVLLYHGDFEGSGTLRIVEAAFENDILYPERGRSCSMAAMPSLGERFQTFRQFAKATLHEVYPSERLDEALRLQANTLESGVLLNDGSGVFQFAPLPRLAQVSPGYGVVLVDADGDGNRDIYLVHNSFSPQPETGHTDGGLSLLLRGDGDGTFTPVWPHESGLVVPGDAKSLAVTDLNMDGRPDFLVGINDGPVMAFENRSGQLEDFLQIRLRTDGTNLDAIGARVEVTLSDGTMQTAETYAGGSYLSQSTPALTFGLGGQEAESIDVRWPEGKTSHHELATGERRIVVVKP